MFEEMSLKRKEVIIEGHDRGKNQREARSDKEKEHDIDINEVNIFNYTFLGRFEGKRISVQFVHFF